jgi:septum formation protein
MTEPYSIWTGDLPLILASKSQIRQELLERAGLSPKIESPNFDERAFETSLRREELPIGERAAALANEKARLVSLAFADHYVVGADQMLTCDGIIFHKPAVLSEAKLQLAFLSNKTHQLISAVSVARNGHILFADTDTAKLTMRAMTNDQIDAYCAIAGDALYQSVGCYQLEGLGVHLFDRVEGDFFTILGIPLEPLIGFLRREGCLSL